MSAHRGKVAAVAAALLMVVLVPAAIAGATGDKEPAANAVIAPAKAKARGVYPPLAAASLQRATQARGCKLSCVKRAFNKLVKAHNQLARAFYKCERTVDVTSYYGYNYGAGTTSALDYTEAGDAADNKMVVWVCG